MEIHSHNVSDVFLDIHCIHRSEESIVIHGYVLGYCNGAHNSRDKLINASVIGAIDIEGFSSSVTLS
jgi:hypothetical protein